MGNSKIHNSCSVGGIVPKILWVTQWVSPSHASKPEVGRSPNKNLGRGQSSRNGHALSCMEWIGFLHCVSFFRSCQRYFAAVEIPNLEFPREDPDFSSMVAVVFVRVSQFFSGFDLSHSQMPYLITVSEDRRGSKIILFPDFSKDSCPAKDEFNLGASFRFCWYQILQGRKSFSKVLPQNSCQRSA